MVWDKNVPVGTAKVSVGDNSIRDNNDAAESAIGREHGFATGGDQSGRHSFFIDSEFQRNIASPAFIDGSIVFADDVRTGRLVFQARNASLWENVDIDPLDSTNTYRTLPRLDEQTQFRACQFALYETVAPVPGTPDTVAIDLATSPAKRVTIVGDTIISNPTNPVAFATTTVQLELTMDATGGIVTFGSEYRTAGGSTPAVDSTPLSKTILYLTLLEDGNTLVSSVSNIAVIT